MKPLLEVTDLQLTLSQRIILQGISFQIFPGETVALVGESGCGKSMTASALLGLQPPRSHVSGSIFFENQDLVKKPLRGNQIGLVLQDPSLALNPLLTIGLQLVEGLCCHQKMSRSAAWNIGINWLKKVGIGNPEERMNIYPHQLSGGMKQRVLIAMALIGKPSLLIADEPTTALDVTVQAQILELLKNLQQEEKMSILLITHDLGVVAHSCQRVMVMYAGQIVETGAVEQLFSHPRHPYTQALLQARRSLNISKSSPLSCLEGHPPLLLKEPKGCPFAPRCSVAMKICLAKQPLIQNDVRCWKGREL